MAQPGGTFMRIKCNPEDYQLEDDSCGESSEQAASYVDYQTLGISRMRNQNISTEIIGDLEPGSAPFIPTLESRMSNYVPRDNLIKQNFIDDSQLDVKTFQPTSMKFKRNYSQPEIRKNSLDMTREYGSSNFILENVEAVRFYSTTDSSGVDRVDGNFIGGNVIVEEYDTKGTKDVSSSSFKHLSSNKDRKNNNNNNNNDDDTNNMNENLKKDDSSTSTNSESCSKGKPYALATLDGTIMLVQDEVILW